VYLTSVVHGSVIQKAWERGQNVAVHGWICDLETGLIHDLDVTVNNKAQFDTMSHSPFFNKPTPVPLTPDATTADPPTIIAQKEVADGEKPVKVPVKLTYT
jgi:hypothetical protein